MPNEHAGDRASDSANANKVQTHASPHPTNIVTDSLLIVNGSNAGARIALMKGTTLIGEDGNPIICIQKSAGHFSVSAIDATVLVTHNGDPLPPAPKHIGHKDSICFLDSELICELDTD